MNKSKFITIIALFFMLVSQNAGAEIIEGKEAFQIITDAMGTHQMLSQSYKTDVADFWILKENLFILCKIATFKEPFTKLNAVCFTGEN